MRGFRQTALVIIFLANLFILAHAVVPHSFHDGVICFSEKYHTLENTCTQDHSNTQLYICSHQDKIHNHGDCEFDNSFIRQDNNQHDEIVPCANCLSLFYVIYTLNEFYLEYPSYEEDIQEKPYINNYTSPQIGYICGLRAPPASYFLA